MAKSGEAQLKTKYPVEEGLTARTQKQEGRKESLKAEEVNYAESKYWGL